MSAEYMRAWRERNTAAYKRNLAADRALARAKSRLAAACPDLLHEFYNEEREIEGLPPVGTVPLGRPKRTATN